MESEKYTDLSYLIEFSNNDKSFIVEMIDAYLRQTPEITSAIKSSYETKNWKDLKDAAHKLKPSMTFLGIRELESVVPEIENMAIEMEDNDELKNHINKLLKITEISFNELKNARQSYC